MKVAIMQPTYLPWIGYFAMMDRVDQFVLLDNVQFEKRSWQQRNRIKTVNSIVWLTVPVVTKGKREQLIKDVLIEKSGCFQDKHIKSITLNYKKSLYFDIYSNDLFEILNKGHIKLPELTIELIKKIKVMLGITTKLICSSELDVDGTKAELIAGICEELNATEYLSSPGSEEYINESDSFLKRNIPVNYHRFNNIEYKQNWGEFVPYISVIDLLFNMGSDSLNIIRKGWST